MTIATRFFLDQVSALRPVRSYEISRRPGQSSHGWSLSKHFALLKGLLAAGLRSRGKDDCYFVPSAGSGLLINALIHLPLMAVFFRKIVLHHHVFSYVRQRSFAMSLMVFVLGDRLINITLGPEMSDELKRNYPRARNVLTLSNARLAEIGSESRRVREDCRNIGFLSNITADKGIASYIGTARAVEDLGVKLHWKIAGPCADSHLLNEIEKFVSECPERRQYLGEVSGQRKSDFFREIDALLFPTAYRNEALPLTILEALASGVPVLATRLGCIPSLLKATDWTAGPEGFVNFASSKLRDWQHPADYCRQATAARKIFDEHFEQFPIQLSRLFEALDSAQGAPRDRRS